MFGLFLDLQDSVNRKVGLLFDGGHGLLRDLAFLGHLTVFDLVYNPLETRLLHHARQSGANAVGGLEMFIWQGALAFELWTGEPAPVEVMRSVCEWALRGQQGG